MEEKQPLKNTDRVPGQGNSDQGVIRREGFNADERGKHAAEEADSAEPVHIEKRVREGSQGDSLGEQG